MVTIGLRPDEDLTHERQITNVHRGRERIRGGFNSCEHCQAIKERQAKEGQEREDLFHELVAQWQAATAGLSSPQAIAGHLAYQQIISMGQPALRLIFHELKYNGGWWYPALRALTGINPVPESAKGRPPLNDEAWLQWGRENDYI